MGVIRFLKMNCKNCYSCVRNCSVNAIRVINDQAEIEEERCIGCGKCIEVCPKNAKEIKSSIEILEECINNKEFIVVSLAPSFIASFGNEGGKLPNAILKLGIKSVEETAVGAKVITRAYEEYAKIQGDNCYLTSSCASLNELIQKHYPELIQNLIPIITPMECHGRMLKKKYGRKVKVFFIGPCIAKKNEGENEYSIDGVLTFEELREYLDLKGINLKDIEDFQFNNGMNGNRNYPILGGITMEMDKSLSNREFLHVDGIDECIEVLEQIKRGRFKNTFIEMNLCRHGCINGPGMVNDKLIVYERRQIVKKFASYGCITTVKEDITDLKKGFISKYRGFQKPSEEEIKQILGAIGKESKKDEINCGTCGYKTCREKAIAVYNGMAEINMCLPYMKQRAESLSNVIFDITPSIILVINNNFEIEDLNPAAERFFGIKKNWARGILISNLIPGGIIESFKISQKNSYSQRVYLESEEATVIINLMIIEGTDSILILINDFTETLKREEELQNMRINAIDMAQSVIDKQMMVAQEIASLLGETTAETKVYLTRLKKIVQGEEK